MKIIKRTGLFVTSLLFCASLCFCSPNDVRDQSLNQGFLLEDKERFIEITNEDESLFESVASLFGLSSREIGVIISLTKVGLGLVDTVHRLFTENFNSTGIDFSTFEYDGGEKKLLNMFQIITHRLDQIEAGVEGTHEQLRDLIRGLPNMVRWEIALDTLEEFTRGINNLFHRFAYYQNHRDEIEEHTLLDFAESVVSHDPHSTHSLMANIHSMAAPSDPPIIKGKKKYAREEYDVYNRVNSELSTNLRLHYTARNRGQVNEREVRDTMSQLSLRQSIFKMLLDAIENYNDCSMRQTPQQLIFGLFTILSIVQARGYAMSIFAYTLLKYYDEGNFMVEQRFADELYTHYSKGIMKEAHKVLVQASNSFRRCDPKKHVEGETYEMITELLQGYVENEVDLNKDGTCRKNCGYYQHAIPAGCYSKETQFCGKERRCTGTVHNCRYFEADGDVCLSNNTQKRYDWIKYEGGTFLGRKSECENKIKVDSWWRFFVHCSYCVCLCDDIFSDSSDRFISLLPSMADTLENKVVTGIRFVKRNRVIHIQIQEGKTAPQGQVDTKSMAWKNVEPINVKSSAYKQDIDYFTLRYEARNIDLDHLKAPKHHAVTGLRFRMLGPAHVNLEIAVTPINFTSGQLDYKLTYWTSNDNTPARAVNPRKKLRMIDPDDPRRSRVDSQVDSHSDMFVELQPTSMHSDLSQLTVPFFDAQPVSPMPATWLEAVELYHRGRPKYGGFLAFRVFNYNLNKHFDEAVIR